MSQSQSLTTTMRGLPIPDSGIVLGAPPPTVGNGKALLHGMQAMRIKFDENILHEILQHKGPMGITFGKSTRITYGDREVEVLSTGEPHRHELYQVNDIDDDRLDFTGTVTHQLEVRELDVDTADESFLVLQESYRRIKKEKVASTTVVVDSASLPPAVSGRRGVKPKGKQLAWRAKSQWEVGVKKRPLSNNSGSNQRASKSPVLSEPDPPVAPIQHSANLSAKLAALRTPLIHLLALGPDSEQNLASRTRVSEDVCLRILQKVGNRNLKLWELVDDIYKDLEIWEFPYPTKANRETAIANCRAAFHRLHLPKDAPEWKKLLGPEGAAAEPSPPPRAPPQLKKPVVKKAAPPPSIKVTGEVKEPSQGSPTSTTVGKKTSGGEPMSRSASQTTTKSRTDAITRIISKKGKKPVAPKARATIKAPRASAKATKAAAAKEAANAKIKSAERIVDSDEDIEMEDVKPLPAKPVDKKPPPAVKRPAPSPVKAPRSVSSAAPSDMEAEHIRLKPTKPLPGRVQKGTAKKRAAAPPKSNNLAATKGSISQLPPAKVLKPTQAQEVRRSSSNSPPKPSPLGSSPPINASDKSTTASSSPSFRTSIAGTATPGMSPLDPVAQASRASRPRYVPSASPPLKRKAVADREESSYSSRSAGRPNTATSSTASSTTTTTTTATTNNNTGSNKRRNISTIDSSTLQLARKFKEDYARYERLYYEVQAMSDKQKQKEKLEVVMTLHRSLTRAKERIAFAASPH